MWKLMLAVVILMALCLPGQASADCVEFDYVRVVGSVVTPQPGRTVAVDGAYAYMADDAAGIQVIDIGDPGHPMIVGSLPTPGPALSLALAGGLAYIANGDAGLCVIDISDPLNPRLIGGGDTPGTATGIALAGTLAYVADGAAGLQVLDVSDPESCPVIGSVGLPGSAKAVTLDGIYAYVATDSGLVACDVSDPRNPRAVDSILEDRQFFDVAVRGRYLFATDYQIGLEVIYVGTPMRLRYIGSTWMPGTASELHLDGSHAYVACAGLRVVDITDPEHAVMVSGLDLSEPALGLAVSGNHVYLAEAGLQVIDITHPLGRRVADLWDRTPEGAAARGSYVYLAARGDWIDWNGLWVVDAYDYPDLRVVSHLVFNGEPKGIALSGNYAWIADSGSGLVGIDITDPLNPQPAGCVDTPGDAQGIAVSGSFVYIADGSSGVQVIDASDPFQPRIAGQAAIGTVTSVAVSGTYVYATRGSRLYVIDVSNPQSPAVLGNVLLPEFAYEVAVSGHYAYLAANTSFEVVDVSDPQNPQAVLRLPLPGWARHVLISGSTAYVGGSSTFRVIDISSPLDPQIVDTEELPYGDVRGLAYWGLNVYVAGAATLTAYANQCPEAGVSESHGIAVAPWLRASPNPTSGPVSLRLSIPAGGPVGTAIYDITGRLVRSLQDGPLEPGEHLLFWNGRADDGHVVPSGIYLARTATRGGNGSTRIAVLRTR